MHPSEMGTVTRMLTGAENTKLCLVAKKAASSHITYNKSFLPPHTTLIDAKVCTLPLHRIISSLSDNLLFLKIPVGRKETPVSSSAANNVEP